MAINPLQNNSLKIQTQVISENEINEKFSRDKEFLFSDFLEDDERDPEEPSVITKPSPMLYQACTDLEFLKQRGYECMLDYYQKVKF